MHRTKTAAAAAITIASTQLWAMNPALASASAFDCTGNNVVVSYSASGPEGEPLFIARFRDEWAIANHASELKVETSSLGRTVTALASPVPDGTVEFLTLILPENAVGQLPSYFETSLVHTKEYTYLDDLPRRSQTEDVSCQAVDAAWGITDVEEGLVQAVGAESIDIHIAGLGVRRFALVRPTTVIFDGYDMAGTHALGRGVSVELLLDADGSVKLINATRDQGYW